MKPLFHLPIYTKTADFYRGHSTPRNPCFIYSFDRISTKSDFILYFVRVTFFLGHTVESESKPIICMHHSVDAFRFSFMQSKLYLITKVSWIKIIDVNQVCPPVLMTKFVLLQRPQRRVGKERREFHVE